MPKQRWGVLSRGAFGKVPALSLEQLSARCREIISEDHQEARERGILYPEVNWPSVMNRALPELDALPRAERRCVPVQPCTAFPIASGNAGLCDASFANAGERGILLGIASNAQAYTLKELELALRSAGLDLSMFQSDLTFWSFEHGFSKPDPHVFEILRARLQNRCLSESETLMIGDREDKDILPARAAGWRTWQLSTISTVRPRGLGLARASAFRQRPLAHRVPWRSSEIISEKSIERPRFRVGPEACASPSEVLDAERVFRRSRKIAARTRRSPDASACQDSKIHMNRSRQSKPQTFRPLN